MNARERDTWLDRSGQRWKLRFAEFVLLGGEAYAFFLFFQATWPMSFYGAIIGMVAGPLAIMIAATVRCRACGHRVVFDAPFGQWLSYTFAQRACSWCGDDGHGRRLSKTDASTSFPEAARQRPRASRFWIATIVMLFVLFGAAIFLAEWFR
ncbi:MAG TPA: hypothetical protein VF841_07085 [Anaeromyxobacter sp.]